VLLDVLKLRCLFETGDIPVQMLQPTMDIWITIPDCPEVCFEQLFSAQDLSRRFADVQGETGQVTVT
jgi:hypothetical protein